MAKQHKRSFCDKVVQVIKPGADNRSCAFGGASRHACGIFRMAWSPLGRAYALAHLAAARTAGVRCAMKCLARPTERQVSAFQFALSSPLSFLSARKPLTPVLPFPRLARNLGRVSEQSSSRAPLLARRKVNAALGHRSGVHMPSLISLRHAQRVSAVL